MQSIKTLLTVVVLAGGVAMLAACAPEVGSEKWCQKIEAKAKDQVTVGEAKDYAKHCVLKKLGQ